MNVLAGTKDNGTLWGIGEKFITRTSIIIRNKKQKTLKRRNT
jgi:hypothetical protein